MRVSDWIVSGFFAYLVVLARMLPLSARHRTRVLLIGMVSVGVVVVLSQLRLQLSMRVTRDWIPAVLLLQGYWTCGLFFRSPMLALEERLLRMDQWLLSRAALESLIRRGPRLLLELLELAYLCAYPFVLIAYGLFIQAGNTGEVGTDRFWTCVLLASLGCYGVLPWIQTRPPRSLEPVPPLDQRHLLFRRVNNRVLSYMSVEVNTVPSGHTATTLAAALAAGSFVPTLLPWLIAFALTVAVATVVGRYHYSLDTLLGLGVGVASWTFTNALV